MTKNKKIDEVKVNKALLDSVREITRLMKLAANNTILARNKVSKIFSKSLQEKTQLMDLAEKFGKEYDALMHKHPLRNSKSKYNKDKS